MSRIVDEAFRKLNEDDEVKNLTCPYCDSTNTKFIDEEEDVDPYYGDDFNFESDGTEHTVTKFYKCKDCMCEFAYIEKDIHCWGINIEEDGIEEMSIEADFDNDWYDKDSDPEMWEKIEEDGDVYYEPTDEWYKQESEFKNICQANGCECHYVGDDEIRVSGPFKGLKELIRGGESTDNYFEHSLYDAYYEYVDDKLPERVKTGYDGNRAYW